jgi:hypothetical protein
MEWADEVNNERASFHTHLQGAVVPAWFAEGGLENKAEGLRRFI